MSTKNKFPVIRRIRDSINENRYKFLFYFVCSCFFILSVIHIAQVYLTPCETQITFENGSTLNYQLLDTSHISNEQYFKQLIDPDCVYAVAYYGKDEFGSVDVEKTYSQELININTASAEELQTLPGIGESKSLEILEYRKNYGNFKSIEELMSVDGIGIGIFSKIQYLICVE